MVNGSHTTLPDASTSLLSRTGTGLTSQTNSTDPCYQAFSQDHDIAETIKPIPPTEPKTSSNAAFFSIVCVMAGTGILQLPYALKSGGWFSLLWIFISGYLVYHSGRFLNSCLYSGTERLNGIMQVGGAAFGTTGRRLVEFSFSTLIIGASGLYLILAANNLLMLDQWTGWSRREWVFVCMLLSCIPFITIKTLKEASFLSLFGVISTVIMVLVVVVISFADFEHRYSRDQPGYSDPEYQWITWSSLPLSLASISFSFGGNIVFPHVEHSMENPGAFNRVLKWSLVFVTMIYSLVAISGYLAYGKDTVSPIFNNLEPGFYVSVAMAMLTLHVLLTIPINLTSFALDAEHSLGFHSEHLTSKQQDLYRISFRVFLSLATLTLAVTVPYFDHVMALLGALSNGMLVFILPPACYIALFGWRNLTHFDKGIAQAMIITGVFVLVVGSSQALVALYHDFTQV